MDESRFGGSIIEVAKGYDVPVSAGNEDVAGVVDVNARREDDGYASLQGHVGAEFELVVFEGFGARFLTRL